MQHLLGAKLVLEFVHGTSIGLLELAAAQPVIERDVGVLDAFEMLEIGERTRRLEPIVYKHI